MTGRRVKVLVLSLLLSAVALVGGVGTSTEAGDMFTFNACAVGDPNGYLVDYANAAAAAVWGGPPDLSQFSNDVYVLGGGILSGSAQPNRVATGDSVTLSGGSLSVSLPEGIAYMAYNLGLVDEGANAFPVTVSVARSASNATPAVQVDGFAATLTATIDDPDGVRFSGDERVDQSGVHVQPLSDFTVTATGGDIEFAQAGQGALPTATDIGLFGAELVASGSLHMSVGLPSGGTMVNLYCSPGEVPPYFPPQFGGSPFWPEDYLTTYPAEPFETVLVGCPSPVDGLYLGSWAGNLYPGGAVQGTLAFDSPSPGSLSGTIAFIAGTISIGQGDPIVGSVDCDTIAGTVGGVSFTGTILPTGQITGTWTGYGDSGTWSAGPAGQSVSGEGTVTASECGWNGCVETTVTSPVPGTITIDTALSAGGSIYSSGLGAQIPLLGPSASIDAPVATADNPLTLRFVFDGTLLPPGTTPSQLVVFRNGVEVPDCTVAGQAVPSPCVAERAYTPGGDAAVTVLTAQASVWNFGVSPTPADTTPPTLAPTVSPNPVILNGVAVASPNATDTGSGVASSSCDPVDTSTVGVKTVTCTATDVAGNTATASTTYSVQYDFQGFADPVDNSALNEAKAGQSIPLKWRLLDAFGQPVTGLPTVSVAASSYTCPAGTTVDQIEEYTAGSSGLQNLGDGYYAYVWKTPKSYATSCKKLSLDLGEGATRDALFGFPR